MNNGLWAVVKGTALYDLQSAAQPMDSLMVGAVYQRFPAVKTVKAGALRNVGGVVAVLLPAGVKDRGGQVLCDSTAEGYVDYLHSLTDAEYGNAAAKSIVKCLKLENIQLGVNAFRAMVAFSEKGRGNIAAAGKHQRVTAGQFAHA